jgi:tRNA threonylcarbamoyladenosine biosynthesis protein TsaB
MNRMLAIETSAETCSVALEINGEVEERFEHAPMKHAELILPAVSALLAAAGIRPPDLDVIAFGRGPGSFTSLRIGIGVVQGLGWGAEVPVVPVSSLACVAQEAADSLSPGSPAHHILVAMDARMQEVFHCIFKVGEDGIVVPVSEEQVSAPSLLDAPGEGPWIAAGNGFCRFDELKALSGDAQSCLPDIWPRASTVLRLAWDWLKDNEPLPAGLAQPVYIRNNVAQKPVSAQSGQTSPAQ